MVHYKLRPMKSETFYRIFPTLTFIIAITTVVLTIFFMFVLQSKNAFKLDSEEFTVDNDDFRMEISGATADQIGNLDIDNISFEAINTTEPTTQQTPQYETFLLKKTINPATNNHIKATNTNNNRRNMKAYKILSKEPIIENSLVKIVMAPHNVLEKLSKHDHGNVKFPIDKNEQNGTDPTNDRDINDIYDGKLNSNGNDDEGINVEVFSLEEHEGNVDFVKATIQPKKDLLHHDLNNIQIIAKSHKQSPTVNSIDQKFPFDLKATKKIENNKPNGVNGFQSVETNAVNVMPKNDFSHVSTPAEVIPVDPTYTAAEELLSNPTTSQPNLIPTLIPEDIERLDSIEINDEGDSSRPEDLGRLEDFSSLELIPDNKDTDVLPESKNPTVFVEETLPSTPDQMSMETKPAARPLAQIIRPKKLNRPTTTTSRPIDVKRSQFPKKAHLLDSYSKYKNAAPKLDDVSIEVSTSLSDVDGTQKSSSLSENSAKSKNSKRAVGDEGKFSSNIVRPSPIRPKNGIGSFLPRETDAERAERLSKSMQRLMHFATIVGQVDSYLTQRVRQGLKSVVRIFDSIEDTRRRRSNFSDEW